MDEEETCEELLELTEVELALVAGGEETPLW